MQSQPEPALTTTTTTQDQEMLVGEQYVKEVLDVHTVGDDAITDKECICLHKLISQMTRPSWQVAPPRNLGEKKHGKLKANELRLCIKFDIPTAFAQLWASDTDVNDKSVLRWSIQQFFLQWPFDGQPPTEQVRIMRTNICQPWLHTLTFSRSCI